MAFIFADLIILPILVIYRKYYGRKMVHFVLSAFYVAMVVAGYIVELVFSGLNLEPTIGHAKVVIEASIRWIYTTILNVVFLLITAAFVYRFIRTGGIDASQDGQGSLRRCVRDARAPHHVRAHRLVASSRRASPPRC